MEVTYEKNTDEKYRKLYLHYYQLDYSTIQPWKISEWMQRSIFTWNYYELQYRYYEEMYYSLSIYRYIEKSHRVVFKHLNDKEMQAFDTYGLHIFRTCDTIAHFLPDLLLTVELFFGGFSSKPYLGPIFGSKPSPWMEKANKEFYKHGMNYDFKDRKNVFVDLDETEVHSGDFLAITRFDGLD